MEKTIPTVKEIDALAQLYVDVQAKADEAQETANLFHQQLITMTQEFGSIAPKSDKTRQIQGDTWIVKVTQGQSVQINVAEVEKLRTFLAGKGKSRLFGKLFISDFRYTLGKDANQLISADSKLFGNGRAQVFLRDKLRAIFNRAVEIKHLSPRLKVETKNKEKE